MSRRNTHTTREEAEHIRRASRPPKSFLSIERSERFPDCLLEIPLATPWPKQTFRPANRTYSLTTTIFQLPIGSSLSIILVCVLSLAQPHPSLTHQPSLAPPPITLWPRSHLRRVRRKLRNTHQELEIHNSTNRENKKSCATSVERKDT